MKIVFTKEEVKNIIVSYIADMTNMSDKEVEKIVIPSWSISDFEATIHFKDDLFDCDIRDIKEEIIS